MQKSIFKEALMGTVRNRAEVQTILRCEQSTMASIKLAASMRGVPSAHAMMLVMLQEYSTAWRTRGAMKKFSGRNLAFKTLLRLPTPLAEKLRRIASQNGSSINDVLNHALTSSTASRRVPAKAETRVQPALAIDPTKASLLSTRYSTVQSVQHLTKQWIYEQAASSNEVWILSPFYDLDFFLGLAQGLRSATDTTLRLVFNMTAGRRLEHDLTELRQLREQVQEVGGRRVSVEARLQRAPGLFHTKLFGFVNRRKENWFMGSANATTAAFQRNEEILAPVDALAARAYAQAIWSDSKDLDTVESQPARTLTQFFRQGALYFEPRLQLSFSYDGLHCPPDYNQALGARSPRIHQDLEPGRALRGYSVKLALGVKDKDEESKRVRASISPYSIETCLGHWVPEAYRLEVEQGVARAGAEKRKHLERMGAKLREMNQNELLQRYDDMLTQVRQAVEQFNQIRQAADEDPWHPNVTQARAGYEQFLMKLQQRLTDEDFLDRASRRYVSTPMPEIWDDPLSTEEFARTFFEYSQWSLSQPGKKTKILRHLRERCRWLPSDDVSDLQTKMEEALERDGWSIDAWKVRLGG